MDSPPRPGALRRLKNWLLAPCLHGFLWVFCLSLAFLLLLQGVFLYGVVSGSSIPLPGRALRAIEAELQGALPGSEVRIGNLSLQADGTIHSRDVELFLEGGRDPVLEIADLEVDLSLPWLFLGQAVPNRIRLRGGRGYTPAVYSPTGVREKVVDALSLDLFADSGRLHLRHLQFKVLDIPVTANGSWQFPMTMPGVGATGLEGSPPLMAMAAGLAGLMRIQPHTDWMEEPALHIHLTQKEGGAPRAWIRAQAEALTLENRFHSSRFHSEAPLEWDGTWDLPEGLSIQARSLAVEPWGTLSQPDILLEVPSAQALSPALLPQVVLRFATTGGEAGGYAFGPLQGRVRPETLHAFTFHLNGTPVEAPVRLSGFADLRTETARLSARIGRIDSARLLQILEGHVPALPEGLQPPSFDSLYLRGRLAPGWAPERVEFDGRMSRIQYGDQYIPSTVMRGTYDFAEEHVELERFHAVFPRGDLIGRMDFTLPSTRIVLSLHSEGFDPRQLNAILPPWWDRLWPDIDFPGTLPHGDFYIENTFTRRHTLFVQGHARFGETTFSGLDFEGGAVRVLVQPSLIQLYDLEARREGKPTSGRLSWVYDPGVEGLKHFEWDVDSQLAPGTAKRIFNEPIQKLFDPFTTTGPVQVRSSGRLYNKKKVPNLVRKNAIFIEGATADPLRYADYPLDSLTFTADWNPSALRIILDSAGIASGEATGWILTRYPSGGAPTLEFDLNLLGAERKRLLNLAERFNTQTADPTRPRAHNPPEPTKNPVENPDGGIVDLRLAANGPLGDPFGFSGRGFFELRDPNLARIGLLGGLTTSIEQNQPTFGTLALNQMGSEIILDRELVRFPNMRITGPVTRIKARGDYSLLEKDLDFNVQVFLGNPDESALISMITSVFRPLTYALELNLSGPLQAPEWKFIYAPGSLLAGPRKERDRSLPEKIRSSEAPEAPVLERAQANRPSSVDHPPYPPPP